MPSDVRLCISASDAAGVLLWRCVCQEHGPFSSTLYSQLERAEAAAEDHNLRYHPIPVKSADKK